MSSLVICIIAFHTRPARAASPPPLSRLPRSAGMICHDRPNLSLSHPHRFGTPPSAMNLSHRRSMSLCVSQLTNNEMAGVKV